VRTRCCVYLRSLVSDFSFAPFGACSFFLFDSHGLRRGLHSFAASRLCPDNRNVCQRTAILDISSFLHIIASKTLGVITPTAGARSRAIRVSCLERPGVRMSLCPRSHGEAAGAVEFPRTARRRIRALRGPQYEKQNSQSRLPVTKEKLSLWKSLRLARTPCTASGRG
jgi:hypothetical protein